MDVIDINRPQNTHWLFNQRNTKICLVAAVSLIAYYSFKKMMHLNTPSYAALFTDLTMIASSVSLLIKYFALELPSDLHVLHRKIAAFGINSLALIMFNGAFNKDYSHWIFPLLVAQLFRCVAIGFMEKFFELSQGAASFRAEMEDLQVTNM